MKKRIAIQGVAGAFHEEAARKFFGQDIEPVECGTFKVLCEKLKKGDADYAIMAIENTIAGSLLPNYALLREYHFKIIGETYLHIQMHLMALPGVKIEDVEFVHSHPIAMRQCNEYLQELGHVKLLEKNDTAEAAKIIKEEGLKNVAAVASRAAANIYGLEILTKNIETNKKNFTRFLALSKEATPEKARKASISFELGHETGTLAKILTVFAEHGVNLTKIQSVVIVGKPYEYAFHVDVEWEDMDEYETAIHMVLKMVSTLSILGEYPKGELEIAKEIDVLQV